VINSVRKREQGKSSTSQIRERESETDSRPITAINNIKKGSKAQSSAS